VNALRRVVCAKWLWLTLGLLQLAIAAGAAAPLRAVLRATMGPHIAGDEGQVLGALLEIVSSHRAVGAAFVASLGGAALLGLLLAPLLSGAAIARLAGPCSPGEQARAALAHYPAALVIGLYGVILRLLLALIAAALGTLHPSLQLVGLIASLTVSALIVDLARARVVLDGARGLHPRTFIRALTAVTPLLWLRSALLTGLQWCVALAIVLVAVHGLATGWAPWAARGLALLGSFVALWRIAVAVEFVRPRRD
jgi:hypothetical protein